MTLKLLVIADLSQSSATMVSDSVDALPRWSRHAITVLKRGVPPLAPGDLSSFDAVVLHYSIFVDQAQCLPPTARTILRHSRAVKLLWQQDEYRNVRGLASAMNDIAADIVLTCLPVGPAERLYGPYLDHHTTFLNVMTGYVSAQMIEQETPPYVGRPIDIGYRGRDYPIWHGRLGALRVRIAKETLNWATARGLTCDVSTRERDRLYGPSWTGFLNRSKATLGTESGASVFDPDGSLPEKVSRYILRRPCASELEIAQATYGPLEELVDYAQISPRLFEAIAARSLLLLSPGRYSGLVVAGRHAMIVASGGGNADDITDTIRDPKRAAEIIEAAHAEVLLRPDLHERTFVRMLDDALEAKVGPSYRRTTDRVVLSSPVVECEQPSRNRIVGSTISGMVRIAVDYLPARIGRYIEALFHVARLMVRRRAMRQRV